MSTKEAAAVALLRSDGVHSVPGAAVELNAARTAYRAHMETLRVAQVARRPYRMLNRLARQLHRTGALSDTSVAACVRIATRGLMETRPLTREECARLRRALSGLPNVVLRFRALGLLTEAVYLQDAEATSLQAVIAEPLPADLWWSRSESIEEFERGLLDSVLNQLESEREAVEVSSTRAPAPVAANRTTQGRA